MRVKKILVSKAGVVTFQVPRGRPQNDTALVSPAGLRGSLVHPLEKFYIENRFFLDKVHSSERK